MNGFSGPNALTIGDRITFPIHAAYFDRELSPGTSLLLDQSYGKNFPNLNFNVAATLLTHFISKPGPDQLCPYLGYKYAASEMKRHDPVSFPQLHDAKIVGHSEEHLVLKSVDAKNLKPGSIPYGFPRHIISSISIPPTGYNFCGKPGVHDTITLKLSS